ncbi:hypothetical protein [Micrococcus sp.]|uniref:hypothetical protein n=1 Tax=Micrococcus sp. TaxID=1271 RepID=UPI0026DBB0E6|nr:hypothetical protein [Micrococcus sp.]
MVTVVSAIGLYVDRHASAGWLPAVLGDAMLRASILGTTLGAAAVCWLVTPLRHRSTDWMNATSIQDRNALTRFVLPWALLYSGAVLACTIGADLLIAAAVVAPTSTPAAHGPLALWLVGTFAWLVAASFLGAVVGWWLPYRWAPLIAGAAVYASYALDVIGSPLTRQGLLGPSGAYGWLDVFPSTTAGALRACLAAAVALTLLAHLFGRRALVALGVVAVVVPIATLDSFADDDLRVVLPPTAHCLAGRTEVCVPLPWAAGLPEYARAIETGLSDLPEPLLPARVSPDTDLAAVSGGLQVSAPGGRMMVSAIPNPHAVHVELAEALFPSTCRVENDAMRTVPYLLGSGIGIAPADLHSPWSASDAAAMPPGDRQSLEHRAAEFAAWPAEQRMAWWHDHAEELQTCSLTEAALP